MAETAILLLAHGTPESLDEIPEYLRNVTGGRPLHAEAVAEITHRYGLIGKSPLTEITQQQGRLLSERLGVPVYVGMRNWKPYIADVVRRMRTEGVRRVVALCMAPHNSRTSVGLYRKATLAEAEGLDVHFIEGWADHPALAAAFAERLVPLLKRLSAEVDKPVPVLFTAHSVPCRTVIAAQADSAAMPDPYPRETRQTAMLVAAQVPELGPWYFAFQSQGMSGGPWLGPTVEETLDALKAEGQSTVILQPIGFLCDHVEILYDVDIAFRRYAAKIGLRLERPESLNDSPRLIEALADLAAKALAEFA